MLRPRAVTGQTLTIWASSAMYSELTRLTTVQTWLGSTTTWSPTCGSGWPAGCRTTAWCSHRPVMTESGKSGSSPWPGAQDGRSGPSTLAPESRMNRSAAGTETTVARMARATWSTAQTPSTTCCASLNA